MSSNFIGASVRLSLSQWVTYSRAGELCWHFIRLWSRFSRIGKCIQCAILCVLLNFLQSFFIHRIYIRKSSTNVHCANSYLALWISQRRQQMACLAIGMFPEIIVIEFRSWENFIQLVLVFFRVGMSSRNKILHLLTAPTRFRSSRRYITICASISKPNILPCWLGSTSKMWDFFSFFRYWYLCYHRIILASYSRFSAKYAVSGPVEACDFVRK